MECACSYRAEAEELRGQLAHSEANKQQCTIAYEELMKECDELRGKLEALRVAAVDVVWVYTNGNPEELNRPLHFIPGRETQVLQKLNTELAKGGSSS